MAIRKLSQQQSSQEQAMLWLNVGYTSSDGEFISIPYGIALDTMQEAKVRGTDPHWRSIAIAKNELLSQLLSLGDQLNQGESKILNGLQIQIYKKQEADETQEVLFEMPHITFD